MIIYHAEDWGFSARNEPRVFHSISFSECQQFTENYTSACILENA